jgi:uncharacterized LabA/DUF88 family protein
MRNSSRSSASSAKPAATTETTPSESSRVKVVPQQKATPGYAKFQRVGIFIDVQNLYHSAKHLHRGRGRVSYRDLITFLAGERQLVRALAYAVRSEAVLAARELEDAGKAETGVSPAPQAPAKRVAKEGEEEQKSSEEAFFAALAEAGIELRLKDLQIYADGSKKADWDVGMAVDAIRTAPGLDVIVLVTGDGDFIPLVDYLRWGMGKYVEVAAFRPSTSGKMQDIADRFIDLTTAPGVVKRTWRRS